MYMCVIFRANVTLCWCRLLNLIHHYVPELVSNCCIYLARMVSWYVWMIMISFLNMMNMTLHYYLRLVHYCIMTRFQ